MHELPVTESILKIILAHAEKNDVRRVVTIRLQVGKLSDLEDDWMQRYFDYVSRGTPAGESYTVASAGEIDAPCPGCGGSNARLVAGREYFIKNMEVL